MTDTATIYWYTDANDNLVFPEVVQADEADDNTEYGSLGEDFVHGEFDDYTGNPDNPKAKFALEYVGAGTFLAREPSPYDYGTWYMSVIERKSDSKLYGYEYYVYGGKHGEAYPESNGFNGEWIWYPVKAFKIQGYTTDNNTNN